MTSTYKILGQLYYGPEINETPEIPGTSGYYTYTTTTGSIDKKFIVISENSDIVLYSTDGITWTQSVMPVVAGWQSIAYGNNKIVAIAYYDSSYQRSPIAAYSTNGINWTQTTLPSIPTVWRKVVYGNGMFVAMPSDPFNYGDKYAYSADGINWTLGQLPFWSEWSRIDFGNNKFVALSFNDSRGMYSTNGINWTVFDLPASGYWRDIIYANNKFMAYDSSTSKIISSDDGINWTLVSNSFNLSFVDDNIVYGNGKYVAVNYYSASGWYSEDGITWTSFTMPSYPEKYWGNIEFGDGKFIAVAKAPNSGFTNEAAYSTDGINWQTSLLPYTKLWIDIQYVEINTIVQTEVQIAIGGQGTPGSYVETVEPQVLYTVPTGKQVIVSSIFVTNHDTVARTYDLAIVPAGETLAAKHHIKWDYAVASNDFNMLDQKITMNAGDSIYVFPSTVNKVGFTALGVEIS